MSDYREMHYAAAENAIGAIARVQECISMGTEACDTAMGAILSATGSTEIDSAQNAMRFVAGSKDMLDECFRATQAAVEELERYQRGF